MKIQLPEHVTRLFSDKTSVKFLSTKDKNGVVHGVCKDSITVDNDGNIRLLEYLETSQTAKNLTYAIWFHELVAVTAASPSGESFQIKGYPKKVLVAGREFESYYREVVANDDVLDLAGVWIIEPEEFREETLIPRAKQEIEEYPIVGHMDREVS